MLEYLQQHGWHQICYPSGSEMSFISSSSRWSRPPLFSPITRLMEKINTTVFEENFTFVHFDSNNFLYWRSRFPRYLCKTWNLHLSSSLPPNAHTPLPIRTFGMLFRKVSSKNIQQSGTTRLFLRIWLRWLDCLHCGLTLASVMVGSTAMVGTGVMGVPGTSWSRLKLECTPGSMFIGNFILFSMLPSGSCTMK